MKNPQEIYTIITACESLISAMLNQEVKLTMHRKDMPFDKFFVQQLVCDAYGVNWDSIKSKCRSDELVLPRMVYCYLIKRFMGTSVSKIGVDIIRNHATVLNALKTIEDYMKVKDEYIKGIYPLIDVLTKIKTDEENNN